MLYLLVPLLDDLLVLLLRPTAALILVLQLKVFILQAFVLVLYVILLFPRVFKHVPKLLHLLLEVVQPPVLGVQLMSQFFGIFTGALVKLVYSIL